MLKFITIIFIAMLTIATPASAGDWASHDEPCPIDTAYCDPGVYDYWASIASSDRQLRQVWAQQRAGYQRHLREQGQPKRRSFYSSPRYEYHNYDVGNFGTFIAGAVIGGMVGAAIVQQGTVESEPAPQEWPVRRGAGLY